MNSGNAWYESTSALQLKEVQTFKVKLVCQHGKFAYTRRIQSETCLSTLNLHILKEMEN